MSYKSFAFGLLGIALGAFTTGALQVVVAWTAPRQAAPLDNVSGPLTVSNISQRKDGHLQVASLSVGSTQKTGAVTSPEFCIGNDCITAWPTGSSNTSNISGVVNPSTQNISCINRLCTGSNALVFPVRNAAGRFNKYPQLCTGTYSIDTRGTNFDSTCSVAFVVASNCNQANTNAPFPNCAENPPSNQTIVNSCFNSVCHGYNSKVLEVKNTIGQSSGPAECAGEWWVNTVGSAFLSTCSTGWII